MAKARSARRRTDVASGPLPSSSSSAHNNNNSNDNEEGVNLLAPPGHDDGLEEEDYGDDGVLIHAPSPSTAARRRSPSPLLHPSAVAAARDDGDDYYDEESHDHDQENQNSTSNNTPRTPRTPNRVRFDLRPTFVDPSRNGGGGSGAAEHHHHARESFDNIDDEEDPLHHHQGAGGGRVPLLTGIEAPSVALANAPWDEDRDGDGEGGGDEVRVWAAAERARPKSGLRMAFMNMANSIIGAGIIGQPYAFRQAGLAAGVVLLVGLTVVVDWTIRLIVVNSKLSGAGSFQGTVERCFGRPGLIAISVAQWAFAFGGMVAFGVIVGDSIPHVLKAVWPGLSEMPVLGVLADRRVVIVVFTMAVSYPLALYRDIAMLAKASTLAIISMAVIVVTVVVQGALAPAEARGSLNTFNLLVINDGIFQAIGVISFAFVCHHNSLLIYGSLETPTIDRFSTVTHYSTGVSMLACLLVALAGFLTFGDKTVGNVLNNLPSDNSMVNIARLCFGLNMLTTLPLEAFVCREVMLNYFYPGAPFNMRLHIVLTTGLVVGAMVISLLTCDLGSVFELVGATSAAAMAYILPPLCYIKLTTRSWKTYVAWGVAVFGCVVMVISMIQAVGKMVRGEGSTAQCM